MQQGNSERQKNLPLISNDFNSFNHNFITLNHAYTAANLAFNRAQVHRVFIKGEVSPNINFQITDDNSYHLSTDNKTSDKSRQKSVRFSGANAVRPRKSTKSKRLNLTQNDSAFVPTTTILNRSNSTTEFSSRGLMLSDRTLPLKTITKSLTAADTYDEYYTNEQDLPSIPSSYRRIQKSKSMFNPVRTNSFPYLDCSMEISQDQIPILSNSCSLQAQFPRKALRVSRSTDYLWAKWRRSESHDSALKQARDRFLHDMKQQKLREKPSLFSRSKLQRIEKNLKKSFRSFSTDDEFPEDLPEHTGRHKVKDSTLRELASKASKSVRSKLKKTFGLSSTDNTGKIPLQQVDNHIRTFDLGTRTVHETVNFTSNLVQKSCSHVPSSICEPGLKSFVRSYVASTNSKKTDSLGENSRVTSWDSTITNTINSRDELDILTGVNQCVNIVKTNDNQITSVSRTNKENSVDQKKLQNSIMNPESAAVSSARVYSALMRRLGTKNPQTVFEATQKTSNNSLSLQGSGVKADPLHSESQESKALPIMKCMSSNIRSKTSTSPRVWEGDAYFSELDSKSVESDDSQTSKKMKKSTKYYGTETCCRMKNIDSNDRSDSGRNFTTIQDHPVVENSRIQIKTSFEAVNGSHKELDSPFKNLPEIFNAAVKDMGPEEVCSKSCGAKIFRENKSTFFSGGTVVLSKATSPFRRAMYEGVCKPHQASSDQPHRCEMRTPETTDSESIYSCSTNGHVRDINASAFSLVFEREREKGKRSSTAELTGGDAIIIERSIYTPKVFKRSRHQYISPINSSEWKAWITSEVAKLNYGKENVHCTTTPNYTSPSSSISRSISCHIREDTQINNDDFHMPQREISNVSLQSSGMLLQQKPRIRQAIPSKLVLKEHSAKFHVETSGSTEPDPSSLTTISILNQAFPLGTIQSNNSIHASGSPIRCSKKMIRDPLLKHVNSKTSIKSIRPNHSSMNLENLLLHQRFRNKEQRDPILQTICDDTRKTTISIKSRFRSGPEFGSISSIKAEDNHSNYERDWWTVEGITNQRRLKNNNNAIDLETVGSKKMVEMFLSSRRKRIASSSCDDTIGEGSSVFL
ncbi:hypothetical protein OnM2_007003 [Erysiphe neolycopersici]|uniref:Uncharacterized protein n=1 Tax=Erysiphe neolycopersici TaxID=212602 RepID=A0A420I736_9PEZI|nr:hypothetical protein OnM2_007003 [Erysiphe neolycopersici]